MFENLTNKFEEVFSSLKKAPSLDEKQVDEGLRGIRQALLEADVSLNVAKNFIESVKPKALGQEIIRSTSPGQMVIKIVYDEIEKIKTQLEPILKKRYNNIKLRNSGIWQGYVEGVRGNVIVYLDKAPYTTDNFIEVTALDRCKIFPEQGEYVWFNDNIKFHRRFNNDEVNNIRFIYFDYKLTNDNDE